MIENEATNLFIDVINPESGLGTIISIRWKQGFGRPDFINVANYDSRLRKGFAIVQKHRNSLMNGI